MTWLRWPTPWCHEPVAHALVGAFHRRAVVGEAPWTRICPLCEDAHLRGHLARLRRYETILVEWHLFVSCIRRSRQLWCFGRTRALLDERAEPADAWLGGSFTAVAADATAVPTRPRRCPLVWDAISVRPARVRGPPDASAFGLHRFSKGAAS